MGTLKDALKKWFYTNNSSAASSDARVALMDSSGNPKGSDTMANLASVLGVAYPITSVQRQSPDNLKEIGLYLYQNSFYEEVIGHNLAGFLFVFRNKVSPTEQAWLLQIYLPVAVGIKNVWFRVSVDDGNTWRDWRKLLAE